MVKRKAAPKKKTNVPATGAQPPLPGAFSVDFGNVERAKMMLLNEINANLKVLNQNMQTLIHLQVKNGRQPSDR